MLVITRWYFIDLKTAEVGTCWNCLTSISLKKGYNMGASCKFLKKKIWILYVISIYIYIYRYQKPKGIWGVCKMLVPESGRNSRSAWGPPFGEFISHMSSLKKKIKVA